MRATRRSPSSSRSCSSDDTACLVINPSAVVEKGKSYQGPDGSSKMPSFNDSMTVQELIDLVAYLGGKLALFPNIPQSAQIITYMYEELNAMLGGEKSAEEAMNALQNSSEEFIVSLGIRK